MSLFVVFRKYVPPQLARVWVGKLNGNFITPDWSNKQWCKLWKVVSGELSEWLDGLLEEKKERKEYQSFSSDLEDGGVWDCWLLWKLGCLSASHTFACISVLNSKCAKNLFTLTNEMLWSKEVCIEEQSPPPSLSQLVPWWWIVSALVGPYSLV